MCDTVACVRPGEVWLAKNSDREPGEAQVVEHLPRVRRDGEVRCTHIAISDKSEAFEVVISRPFWMWGAEMGVNEKGVAIGNEAVFTNQPVDTTGLTGMDLVRLALERAESARAAVDIIRGLLSERGQGGRMGYRHTDFSYSSSFLIADPSEAWVMESAGRHFAAERVTSGVRSISNGLTIRNADLADEGSSRDFVRDYDRPAMAFLAGASSRRSCTASRAGPSLDSMMAALRDHGGKPPSAGLRMVMPCAHASFLPTRSAGQTSASMIACLRPGETRVWMTGTSSPCLSVFKGIPLATGAFLDVGPAPAGGYDTESLWWRHERLHREMLRDWSRYGALRQEIDAFERTIIQTASSRVWEQHRDLVDDWRVSLPPARVGTSMFSRFWERQSRLDAVPSVEGAAESR